MVIFDVKTLSGNLVSTLSIPEDDAIFLSQIYNNDYLKNLSACKGEELIIKKRIEIDKHAIQNKMLSKSE